MRLAMGCCTLLLYSSRVMPLGTGTWYRCTSFCARRDLSDQKQWNDNTKHRSVKSHARMHTCTHLEKGLRSGEALVRVNKDLDVRQV
jgi:hypothetical protein